MNRLDVPSGVRYLESDTGGVFVDLDDFLDASRFSLLPEAGYLSEIYSELRIGATSNGFGAAPLSWADIYAYCRLTGVRLNHWMLNLFRQVDLIYLKYAAEKQERDRQPVINRR